MIKGSYFSLEFVENTPGFIDVSDALYERVYEHGLPPRIPARARLWFSAGDDDCDYPSCMINYPVCSDRLKELLSTYEPKLKWTKANVETPKKKIATYWFLRGFAPEGLISNPKSFERGRPHRFDEEVVRQHHVFTFPGHPDMVYVSDPVRYRIKEEKMRGIALEKVTIP